MPPVTLNFWSLINGTVLEAGSPEIVGVGKETHIASISTLDRLLLSPALPTSHKTKMRQVWKTALSGLSGSGTCRKYRVCRVPEEKAVVIALIIAIAPRLLVPATPSANDCFR